MEIIEREDCPKRLLLGSDAVRIVSEELADRIGEIKVWKAISVMSDY